MRQLGKKAVSILIPLPELSTNRHVSLMTWVVRKFQPGAIFSHWHDFNAIFP